jgi:hypothetical protein
VEEAGVRGPQQSPEHRVLLVPRAGNGVETLAASLEGTGCGIQGARQDLVLEEPQALAGRQPAPRSQGLGRVQTPPRWKRGGQEVVELLLDDRDAVVGHGGRGG